MSNIASYELKDLQLGYAGWQLPQALTLAFPKGAISIIMGENGSGKTSLLKTMAGLQKPLAGEVHYQQQALHALTIKKRAEKINYLGQMQTASFPQTVNAYLIESLYSEHGLSWLGDATTQQRIEQVLTQFDLLAQREQNMQTLSGGQRQRVELARIALKPTETILLDEPLNHLDIKHQQSCMQWLQTLAQQERTIIISLHDINMAARFADYILLLMPETNIFATAEEVLTVENLEMAFDVKYQKLETTPPVFLL